MGGACGRGRESSDRSAGNREGSSDLEIAAAPYGAATSGAGTAQSLVRWGRSVTDIPGLLERDVPTADIATFIRSLGDQYPSRRSDEGGGPPRYES